MTTGNSPSHRRVLAAVATALAICLAVALAAPRAQAAPATPARPAALAAAVQHLPADRTTVLHVNCSRNCLTYTICLLGHRKLCLGVWGVVDKASAIAGLIGFLITIWQVIKNKKDPDQSDKDDGTEGGSDKGKDLCLAAAATTSDTHDRVYVTSNCSGNKYASWRCVEVARNACNYYNVASLDQGDSYELTTLNTRDHADVYVKPATSGDWQAWLWTYWDTCKKNCLHHHTSRAKVSAGQASIPG
jgi:hypothetical protein